MSGTRSSWLRDVALRSTVEGLVLVFKDSGFRKYIQRSDDVCMRSRLQLTGVVILNADFALAFAFAATPWVPFIVRLLPFFRVFGGLSLAATDDLLIRSIQKRESENPGLAFCGVSQHHEYIFGDPNLKDFRI